MTGWVYGKVLDDRSGIVAGAYQMGQEAHGFIDVAEEVLVAGAQIVQAGLLVWGGHESVFGTATTTGKEDIAGLAHAGERIPFVLSEGPLLGKGDEV